MDDRRQSDLQSGVRQESQNKAAPESCNLERRKFLIASGVAGAGLAGMPGVRKAIGLPLSGRAFAAEGADFDAIIVGSGINSLVAAAMLAKAGWRVCVLERNDRPGGCMRTEELTLPGFKHDSLSCWHPLFVTSPAYAALKDDLHAQGLEYLNTNTPTAALLPDNHSLVLKTDRKQNIQAMDELSAGDGQAYHSALEELAQTAGLTFGMLGKQLYTYDFLKLILTSYWKMGLHDLATYFGYSLISVRAWLENSFRSELTRALLAPWPMHTGLGPEDSLSGFMDQLIFFSLEVAGLPVVKGGSHEIVAAFVRIIESHKGTVVVNADVEQVVLEGEKATGVKTRDGKVFTAGRAVICSVTPRQLYERLLDPATLPAAVVRQARGFRFGRGDMQIHLALSEPPQWAAPGLDKVGMVHVTSGLDGVSKAVNEAVRGYLPEEATIVVGQPAAIDPSRAPAGKSSLWLQLQELPSNGNLKGDSAGKISTPADGRWNVDVRERYADRIIQRLVQHIPNLQSATLARKVLSPADLEEININLVGGDPYSGVCSIDQYFLWRPLRATKNHATPFKNLFIIGASTHPGPGLGGVSGFLVAKELLG